MELVLEESGHVQFFQFHLRLHRLQSSEKNRLSESEAEAEEPTNHKAQDQIL